MAAAGGGRGPAAPFEGFQAQGGGGDQFCSIVTPHLCEAVLGRVPGPRGIWARSTAPGERRAGCLRAVWRCEHTRLGRLGAGATLVLSIRVRRARMHGPVRARREEGGGGGGCGADAFRPMGGGADGGAARRCERRRAACRLCRALRKGPFRVAARRRPRVRRSPRICRECGLRREHPDVSWPLGNGGSQCPSHPESLPIGARWPGASRRSTPRLSPSRTHKLCRLQFRGSVAAAGPANLSQAESYITGKATSLS